MAEDVNNIDLDMDIFGEIPGTLDLETGAEPLFPEEDVMDDEAQNENEEESINEDESSDEVVGELNREDVEDDIISDNESDESSPNLFSSLTDLLVEKGLLSSTESKPEDEDSFANLIRSEIQKNEYADLSDNQKAYLQSLRDGIPEEEVKTHLKVQAQFDSIKEEHIDANAELRQKIIYNDFINKGFTEAKAIKLLQRSIELEADVEDAKEALASIKEFDKENFEKRKSQIQKDKEAKEQAETKRIETLKNKIKTSKEIITGFPLTDNVKEQVEKNMFNVVSKDPNGNSENALMKYARENTEDYQLITNYLYTITKGFKDFSIIEKTKNTKIVNSLEKAIQSSTRIKDNGAPAFLQDPDSYSIEIAGHDLVTD